MQASFLSVVLLPVALAVIMMGLGLSLVVDDFKRVVVYPKAVVVGLACQVVVLPLACYGLVKTLGMEPVLAVGMMLLAASPGGPTANLYSHIAKGDVALNVTLTAVNSVVSIFTLPLIVNLSIAGLLASDQAIPLQFGKILEVCVMILIPVSIGMLVRNRAPGLAARLDKPVKVTSAGFLLMVILLSILKEKSHIVNAFRQVGLAALAFNILSLATGYYAARLFRLDRRQAIAIGMEIGIHNGTLAIFIALSVIGNSDMSIPPVIYSLIMFVTAAVFGYWVNRGKPAEA
jgi:BASS family bile acid:Na+ symporter